MEAEARRNTLALKAYAAAGSSVAWKCVLRELAHHFGVDGAWLFELCPHAAPRTVATAGYEESWVASHEARYVRINPYLALYASLPHGRALLLDPMLPTRSVEGTAFHREFLSPQGYGLEGTVLAVHKVARGWALHCQWRGSPSERQRQAALDEQQWFLPHFAAALQSHLRLLELERTNRDLARAVELTQLALCVYSAEGKILFMGAAARTLLASTDSLFYRDGRLQSCNEMATAALEQAVRMAIRASEEPGAAPPSSVRLSCTPEEEYEAVVCPLPPRYAEALTAQSRVLVILQRSGQAVGLSQRLLCELYGLTGQQARVARLLARGQAPQRVAEELSIARETMKSHLKAIYGKTGTRRQGQLVAKLLGGLARVAEGEVGGAVERNARRPELNPPRVSKAP